MSIINYLDLFVGALINTLSYLIIIKKVFKTNVNKNKALVYLLIIMCAFAVSIINYYDKDTFKILLVIPIVALITKYIMQQPLAKTIIMSVVGIFYLFISEIIVILIATGLNIFDIKILGSSFGNIIIMLVAFLFLKFNKLKIYFNRLLDWFSHKLSLLISVLFILIVGTISYKNIKVVDNYMLLILNTLLTIMFIYIILLLIKEHESSEKISKDYNVLISHLSLYEKELIDKRKIIHDFNNKLIVINGLVDPNNEKLETYMKTLIKEQKQITNNTIIMNIDKLPLGLKGLLHYKILEVNENLKVKLYVEEDLKNYNIDESISNEYLKIVGILMDNACEASIETNEKMLEINVYIENGNVILQIINSTKEKVNISNIYKAGYSTKGPNRGYGMNIVKEIVDKNGKIKIAIESTNNTFITTLTLIN